MSYIIYEGPSLLDNKPIVVIMTAGGKSKNEKTGGMAQTYILRSDIPPLEAIKTGEDASICGECPHRPSTGGSCYVNVGQGPRSVWEAYKRGVYKHMNPVEAGTGQSIRLGAYGDLAMPHELWYNLISKAKNWTGYTHQPYKFSALKGIVQASADSKEQALSLQQQGWKTFRVKTAEEPLLPKELMCPNTTHGVQCKDCNLCQGNKANIAIDIHGLPHKIAKFKTWRINAETTEFNGGDLREINHNRASR